MALYKCKICGGDLKAEPGETVGVCESCGTKQTLPKWESEKRALLINRVTASRVNYEFSKAVQLY